MTPNVQTIVGAALCCAALCWAEGNFVATFGLLLCLLLKHTPLSAVSKNSGKHTLALSLTKPLPSSPTPDAISIATDTPLLGGMMFL